MRYVTQFRCVVSASLALAVIASNFQTCLGLLMHYPPIGDIHSLLHKALFLRDPKVTNHADLLSHLPSSFLSSLSLKLSLFPSYLSFLFSDFRWHMQNHNIGKF